MKTVNAKLTTIRRKGVSWMESSIRSEHLYDDNVLAITLQVTSGPEAWLDRLIKAEIAISDFVSRLPLEVAIQLRNELEETLDRLNVQKR